MIRGREVRAQERTTGFIHTFELVRVNLRPYKAHASHKAIMKNMLWCFCGASLGTKSEDFNWPSRRNAMFS